MGDPGIREKEPRARAERVAVENRRAEALAAARGAEVRISAAVAEEAKRKFTRIDAFEGVFEFLSPDSPHEACWDGAVYQTARHAWLAAQFPEAAERLLVAVSTAEMRKATKGVAEAEGWASRRLQDMEKIQRDKFRRSADLRKKIQETGSRELLWDDEDGYWGSGNKRGQNHMGRIIMEIRTSVQEDTEFEMWLNLCCELEPDKIRRPDIELLEVKDGDGTLEQKKVHRLSGKSHFKIGKLSTSAIVALHPSVSREHAILVHTRAKVARRTHGVALIDLGSKAGTSLGNVQLPHPFVMEPVRPNDVIKLGASTRHYTVKVNLASQIELLERTERALLKEVSAIDRDAQNPLEAVKRQAREEATVFVGGLDYETEKADLLGLFQDCGKVDEVRFPGQGATTATRGICFVVLESSMAARRACGLSGQLFKGRKVKVAPAAEDRSDDMGGGGHEDGKGSGRGKGKGGKTGSRALMRDEHDHRGPARKDHSLSFSPLPRERRKPSPAPRERDRSPARDRNRERGGGGRHEEGRERDRKKKRGRSTNSASPAASSHDRTRERRRRRD